MMRTLKHGKTDERFVRNFCSTTSAYKIIAATLKNSFFAIFVAVRTYEVKLRIVRWKILRSVGDTTNFSFLHLVVLKLGSRLLLDALRLQHLRQFDLQLRIRKLRIRYLKRQIREKRFHLFVSTRLRRLEKAFDTACDCNDRICCLQPGSGEFESIADGVRVQCEILQKANGSIEKTLSEISYLRNSDGTGRL